MKRLNSKTPAGTSRIAMRMYNGSPEPFRQLVYTEGIGEPLIYFSPNRPPAILRTLRQITPFDVVRRQLIFNRTPTPTITVALGQAAVDSLSKMQALWVAERVEARPNLALRILTKASTPYPFMLSGIPQTGEPVLFSEESGQITRSTEETVVAHHQVIVEEVLADALSVEESMAQLRQIGEKAV